MMKLGILTAPFPDTPLAEVANWAAGAGFSALEIACWPSAGTEKRRYAGTAHLPIETMTATQASEIMGMVADRGLTVSGLGYYPNPLHADAAHRDAVIGHLRKVISAAALMNVSVVNTFVGGDRTLPVDQNWARAVEIFTPIVRHARENGVTLAFENCPMIFSLDEWPGGHNIAYAPRIWRRIFETWGDAVGMNYDPSHLVWQMIDQDRFIREFGGRMVHVHAKDLMIDRDGLYENGILSAGMGWQVPRMPGLGEVNWPTFFSGLYRAGYEGPIIIEHEDRTFEGTEEKIKRGFALARDVLRPFVK
jgi:sugar phosphate isomerase/epimerase